jgi:SAM-dependent methyltransferase
VGATGDPVRDCYDAVADAYAARFTDELAHKPLDRALLGRFADATRGAGPVADLGCGPGQTTAFLQSLGVDARGIDLSAAMARQAGRLHPGIVFETGDMRGLGVDDGALAGVVAFYAIVHCSPEELRRVCGEMYRVLRPGGLALLAFHIGDETRHVEEFLGQPVAVDFVFWPVARVADALRAAGFADLDIIERDPYPEVEYPSRRAYVFAAKPEA